MQSRVYQTKICSVDERRVIDVWTDLNSRLSTWLLTTSVEDFERASIHYIKFEHNLLTGDINFVSICHFQCNFCMNVTICYIFHSKSMPATRTITPTRVFVLKGSAAEKSVCSGRFYSTLRRRYFLSDMPKNIKIGQQLSKLHKRTLYSQFHVQDALSAFTR